MSCLINPGRRPARGWGVSIICTFFLPEDRAAHGGWNQLLKGQAGGSLQALSRVGIPVI